MQRERKKRDEFTLIAPDRRYIYYTEQPRYKMLFWWFGLIPIVIVMGILAFGYYVLLVRVVLYNFSDHVFLKLFQIVLGNTALFLMLSSYFQCVATSPGYAPVSDEWNVDQETVNEHKQRLENSNDPSVLHLKICTKCCKYKPIRAHHCSVCKRCVLKMDHHCPWVNNCVGLHNHKFFVLFLTYIPVLALVSLSIAVPHAIWEMDYSRAITTEQIEVFIIILISFVFGMGLGIFAGSHYYLALINKTTLEGMGGDWAFDAGGYRRNFEQVFGTNPWLWFLPVHTSLGDGITYPTHPDWQCSLTPIADLPRSDRFDEEDPGNRLLSFDQLAVEEESQFSV